MADEEVTEEEGGLRSQMWKHEAMVTWINERDGVDLDQESAASIIAYAFARRVEWRQSDTYKELVEAHKAEAAEAAQARKEAAAAAKAEREAAKAAADAEKAAAAEKAEKTPAKATKATKTPAKATKATKATKKAAGGDSPFD